MLIHVFHSYLDNSMVLIKEIEGKCFVKLSEVCDFTHSPVTLVDYMENTDLLSYVGTI